MQLLRIQPTAAFGVDWTAKMIFIVVIGGLGRIEGPIVGTIVFFALQETLADYGSLYLVILGVVAIAIVAPRAARAVGPVGWRGARWNRSASVAASSSPTRRARPGSDPELDDRARAPDDRGAGPAVRLRRPTSSSACASLDYLADDAIGLTVFLADRLEKPILSRARPASARPSWPGRWRRSPALG